MGLFDDFNERLPEGQRKLSAAEQEKKDLEMVKQDGLTLQHVEKQTSTICMEAVRQNGKALEYVKEQTPEICLAAVQQNGNALRDVKEQTEEICLVAVKQNKAAICYIHDREMRERVREAARGQASAMSLF